MNKKIMILLIILFSVFKLNAQHQKGDALFNLGLGMSSYYTSGAAFKSTVPPLETSFESFVGDNFSIGGFLGYYKAKYENVIKSDIATIDTKIKYNYLSFGAVANYHFVDENTFNIYLGGKLGYVSSKTKVSQDIDSRHDVDIPETNDPLGLAGATVSGITYSAHIGARYYLSKSFALNAELGYGISLLKVGLSFKL